MVYGSSTMSSLKYSGLSAISEIPGQITPKALMQYRIDKMLSYRRETSLQHTLVLAKSGRLELGDNILLTL